MSANTISELKRQINLQILLKRCINSSMAMAGTGKKYWTRCQQSQLITDCPPVLLGLPAYMTQSRCRRDTDWLHLIEMISDYPKQNTVTNVLPTRAPWWAQGQQQHTECHAREADVKQR